MIRRPPRSTRTDTLFPTRRSSDLVKLRLVPSFQSFPIADLIDCIEGALKTPVQAAVKREDEQAFARSEEHTSELQSLMRISYAVFCLKKKKQNHRLYKHT